MALANGPFQGAQVGQFCEQVVDSLAFGQQQLDDPQQLAQDDSPVLEIHINNVVSSFSTRCHLNLRKIAMEGMHVVLRKESGMVSMKIRKPYTTASIWSSGKITVTGATSEEEGKKACRRIARVLQKLGFRCRFANFRVVNVLGTCSFPFGIKIQSFSRKYPREASYEPELHPGVTYKIRDPKATLKIFSTGSITVTAPRVINIQHAIQHIYPLVSEFQMEKPQAQVHDEVLQALPVTSPKNSSPIIPVGDSSNQNNVGRKRYQPLPSYKSLKRPKEDWSGSDEDFDSDDSQD